MAHVDDGAEVLEVKPRRHYKTSLIWYCCGASWSAAAYGFGACIMATTIGQPSFLREMNLDTASNSSGLIGAANAMYFVGGFIGAILTAIFADKYGRRPVIAAGAVVMLLSTAVLAGSVHIGMFICFRFLAGLGGYMALTAGPLLITELVPPKHRGILLDINPIFTNIGYTSASWIGVGFFFYKNADSWRGPIAIGCLPCILSLVSIYFVPESPRYYLLKGRAADAWEVVKNLHTTDGDESFARREFEQMNHQIQFERSLKGGYREMIRRPSYRKRTLMVILLIFTLVSSGVLVITSYATIIYRGLGYSSQDQLFLQAGWQTASFLFNLVALFFVDIMPRPRLIVIGLAGCCTSLVLEAAMVATYGTSTNKAGLGACVAFNYLFVFFYGGFLDGVTWWYAGEIFPTHLRARGMTIGMSTYAITNIVWLQAAPSAFATIGWKYYLFFIVISLIGTIIIWFTFPDTLNKPLEEVAALFGDDDLVDAYRQEAMSQDNVKDKSAVEMEEHSAST